MRRLDPKYIRIALIVLVSVIIIALIGGAIAYSKREALLQKAISKAKLKARRDYNLDVKIGSAKFVGMSTVAFTNISVVPDQRDSLLSISKFNVAVKIFPLIFGTIKLSDVTLEDGHLNLTSIKGVRNFEFLFKKKKDTLKTNNKADLAQLADNLVNQVLYKIPDNLNLKNFNTTYRDDSTHIQLLAQSAIIKDGDLMSTILMNDGTAKATWHFAGKMHPSDKNIDVRLYADHQKVELPIIEKKFKLKLNFDTISTQLKKVEHSNGETRIYGSWGVRNLLINHAAISNNDIIVPEGSIDANLFVGENYVSVDSSSVIHLKKITANPYIKYTLNPTKIYELKLHTDWLDAQDIFDSFPQGMFESLEGIKVAGKLSYNLNFFLNTKRPDDLKFDSRLSKDGFKIVKYGKTDFNKLNGVFVYTPYEKGKPMPPRTVGPQNPYFTPLEDIAPILRYSVMTAEDPSFYRHHGFVDESIRKSIVTDFKEKKFKRGGSTISMQLVKNAFLSRKKTLVRKIEEILIVWVLENTQVISKNRMLEVYLNIIEWGRNIYGIGEASRFYFGKSPGELTLGESIYLASIVPSPKNGMYAFNPDGTLRYRLHGYFNLIGRLMAGKGFIQRDTNAYGFYNVRLREGLRQRIAPIDTAVADSLLKQAEDDPDGTAEPEADKADQEKKPGFFSRLFGGGKKDSTKVNAPDSAEKAKKLQKERKEERKRLEKERKRILHERGLG
jgi:hypothetical protein